MARRRARNRSLERNLRFALLMLGVLLAFIAPALGCFVFAPFLQELLGLPPLASAYIGVAFAEAFALGAVALLVKVGR